MLEGRVYNFSAGPSILPESVLLRAQGELLNLDGSGMSVLEMSHRGAAFEKVIEGARDNIRELLSVPEDYEIEFLQGGGTGMFAAIPMNLGGKTGTADYLVSGVFSGNAYKEAGKYLKNARLAGTTKDEGFVRVPRQSEMDLDPSADYLHICYNNTIYGTRWNILPESGDVPLVADMSSSILSEPVDVKRYGMIYAGVQKNLAPAGCVLVIVRKDLLGHAMDITPSVWNFTIEAEKESMLNTPPAFSIYMTKLVTEWIRDEVGGLENMRARNEEKAARLYAYLDGQDYYKAVASKEDRSIMNVTFRTGSKEADAAFCAEAADHGIVAIKGHRLAGGMRASIYNAMPSDGIDALIAYMEEFRKKNQ